MKQAFLNDYYRMSGKVWSLSISSIIYILTHHNIRFIFWWRIRAKKNTFLSKYAYFKLSRKYGLEISPSAKIGSGLYMGHPYNITIGDGVVIGNNCNIHKGATVGVENRGIRLGAPKIGNQVYIGINACIIGKIQIGDDVLIAPGAYVYFDVPSHSLVIGNPGRIISRHHATEGYIRNMV